METIIEYLSKKKKIEIVAGVVFFVVIPVYLIEFLYYPVWFENMDIIKITVLNIGILAVAYIVQVFLYAVTNMVFTKKGRSTDDVLRTPLVVLGIAIYLVIASKIVSENLKHVLVINLLASALIDGMIAIIYEKSDI